MTISHVGEKKSKATSLRRVFYPSAFIVAFIVAVAAIAPKWLKSVLDTANRYVVASLTWYYVLAVFVFIVFLIFVAASRFGDIKLGKDDDEPDYSMFTWFAMLFAAGMGIGLVFYGTAEPLYHFMFPAPGGEGGTPERLALAAQVTTFLHWGFHGWAVYAIVGVSMAYAVHRRGRPMSIRWMLEPLLGTRVNGRLGDVIDIAAIIGTLFGVTTSLGLGATQVASGLKYLGVIADADNIWLLLALVLGITAAATASVVSGLDKGIKWLSNSNLVLAFALMILILLIGQPLFVLRGMVEGFGEYIQNFLHLSFRTLTYYGDDGASWMGSWTTFYWGWWISWSPFVGIFIARVSKGRTVREFITGVLAVPTSLVAIWFSVLGGTAIWQQLYGGKNLVGPEGIDFDTTLFLVLDNLPGGALLSGLFMILLVIFFVTSSDSASFVLGMLSSNGNPNPPLGVRLFWAIIEGGAAAVLLWLGYVSGDTTLGIKALQILVILAAVPFSVVLITSMAGTFKAFRNEHKRTLRIERAMVKRELELEMTRMVDEAAMKDVPEEEEPAIAVSGFSSGIEKVSEATKPVLAKEKSRHGRRRFLPGSGKNG